MKNVAKNVIEKFGHGEFRKGVPVVADILGIHVTRVYRMTYEKKKGGTGGLIPAEHQIPLLEGAEKLGINLEPSDFFYVAA